MVVDRICSIVILSGESTYCVQEKVMRKHPPLEFTLGVVITELSLLERYIPSHDSGKDEKPQS
jgi:hypothetical protein